MMLVLAAKDTLESNVSIIQDLENERDIIVDCDYITRILKYFRRNV